MSATRRDELIEELASKLEKWSLVGPAIFLLEAHRPLSFLASSLLLTLQPATRLFPGDVLGEYALLLEDRSNVERMISRLEAPSAGLD